MSGILLSAVGSFAQPVAATMTIGSRTINYTAGKTFDYYDASVTAVGNQEVTITVSSDITVDVTLVGGGGASTVTSSNNGTFGGRGGVVNFRFTFKSGVVYKLVIGGGSSTTTGGRTYTLNAGASTGNVEMYGGGYSGLFLGSVSQANAIAVAGGGGSGVILGGASASPSTVTNGGNGGVGSATSVTNGIAWSGDSGTGNQHGKGGSGTAGGAAGTGISSINVQAGSALQGGRGCFNIPANAYGGGGGAGYWGGGGGVSSSSTPTSTSIGGGGGGSSFAYTADDGSGKTCTNVSNTGSGGTAYSAGWEPGSSPRPLALRAGGNGLRLAIAFSTTTTAGSWMTTPNGALAQPFLNWLRPIPSGSGTLPATTYFGLYQPCTPGSTTLTCAWIMSLAANYTAGAATLTVPDARKTIVATQTSISILDTDGTTYTRSVTAISLSGSNSIVTLSSSIPVNINSGTLVYSFGTSASPTAAVGNPISTNTAGTVWYASATNFNFFRISETAGSNGPNYTYGMMLQNSTTGFTGGGSTAFVISLPTPIYPIDTIPRAAAMQRMAMQNATADAGGTMYATKLGGAWCGSARFTFV